MKTRIIHTRFWQDEYICSLNDKEKLLFIYLLTNDKNSLTGTYELLDKYICADLGWTNSELKQVKEKLEKDGKFRFFKSWVQIINHDKYNNFRGKKLDTAIIKEIGLVPEELSKHLYCPDTSIDTSSDTPNKDKDKDKHLNKDKDNPRIYEGMKKIDEDDFELDLSAPL